MPVHALPSSLRLREAHLDLVLDGDRFRGVGDVRVGGTTLRSGGVPLMAAISDTDGRRLEDWRLVDLVETEHGHRRLTLRPARQVGGARSEWMVHEVRTLVDTGSIRDEAVVPEAELVLELWPVERLLAGHRFRGFGYRWHYRSEALPIYRIDEGGSWEPGGSATGCEILQRTTFVPPRYRISGMDDRYSTARYLPQCANPHMFQFLPLQTELQGFTCTLGAGGMLVTWAAEPAHVRTLVEKRPGEDHIVHLHEHCADLAPELASAPMEVLWCDAVGTDTGAVANAYEAFREHVHGRLHGLAGLRRERITSYVMLEEWGFPDLDHYTDVALERIAQIGVKWVGLANHFANNMNHLGLSNMCCTIDLQVAPGIGEDRLRRFCHRAREAGIQVEMWGNTALSTLHPLFYGRDGGGGPGPGLPPLEPCFAVEYLRGVDDAFITNASGSIEADHYAPRFACLNLRSEAVRRYWLDRWDHAHVAIGLEGLFLDSSFNLSSDKFHWVANTASGDRAGGTTLEGSQRRDPPPETAPRAIASQYHAHLSLMAEMQRRGYRYNNEDHGVFGIHRHGANADIVHDTLFMWADCLGVFDPVALREMGLDPDRIFFAGLAHRLMWTLHWQPRNDCLSWSYAANDPAYHPSEAQLALLHAFDRVEPHMLGKEVVADGRAVRYRDGAVSVLWCVDAVDFENPATCEDVLAGTIHEQSRIQAPPGSLWLIHEQKAPPDETPS